jgi:hypothetical protein
VKPGKQIVFRNNNDPSSEEMLAQEVATFINFSVKDWNSHLLHGRLIPGVDAEESNKTLDSLTLIK